MLTRCRMWGDRTQNIGTNMFGCLTCCCCCCTVGIDITDPGWFIEGWPVPILTACSIAVAAKVRFVEKGWTPVWKVVVGLHKNKVLGQEAMVQPHCLGQDLVGPMEGMALQIRRPRLQHWGSLPYFSASRTKCWKKDLGHGLGTEEGQNLAGIAVIAVVCAWSAHMDLADCLTWLYVLDLSEIHWMT